MLESSIHNLQSIQQLQKACTPHGIVASTNSTDNYDRIWARDSVIAGLAGIFIKDKVIIEGLRQSLITLQQRQADTGQLPSNVSNPLCTTKGEESADDISNNTTLLLNNNATQHESTASSPLEQQSELNDGTKHESAASSPFGAQRGVSYGGLTGRVDATTWWIIGVCEYLKYTKQDARENADLNLPEHFYHSIKKAFTVLKAWEMNTRGLLYSPLGGNWADEYVTQGYTLYDNCLYLWALEAAAEVFENKAWAKKGQDLRILIQTNFYLFYQSPNSLHPHHTDYHPTARQNAPEHPLYWIAALAPNGYDTRFDMAGNALAEYLNIGQAETTTKNINNWLTKLAATMSSSPLEKVGFSKITSSISSPFGKQRGFLLPVFYPIIHPNDPDWRLLHNNFAYNFKNYPHHFHNGGCWFVWLGFLAMALRKNGCTTTADAIATQIKTSLEQEDPPYTFYEYRTTDTFECGGMPNLSFSAAGAIFSTHEC